MDLLKDVSDLALILSSATFALVCIIFAVFLKPKIDAFDNLKTGYDVFKSRFDSFDSLKSSYDVFKSHFDALKVDDNLRDLQNLKTAVAVLNSAEERRDQKVREAIEAQSKSLKDLEVRINQAVKSGDSSNLRLFLVLREEQAETAYTLSRIQGGTKEEEARNEWIRAKDELARFLAEEQKPRADFATTSG